PWNVCAVDDVEASDACGAAKRVVVVVMAAHIALGNDVVLYFAAGDRGADTHAPAEVLRNSQDIGNDTVLLEGEHRAQLAEASLCLVEDEQHFPFFTLSLQLLEPDGWRGDDSTSAEQRFSNDRRQRSYRL